MNPSTREALFYDHALLEGVESALNETRIHCLVLTLACPLEWATGMLLKKLSQSSLF